MSGYLVHSRGPWKNHKYIRKVGDTYVYDIKDAATAEAKDAEKVQNAKDAAYGKAVATAKEKGGGRIGDTYRDVKGNPAGVGYKNLDKSKEEEASIKNVSGQIKFDKRDLVKKDGNIEYYIAAMHTATGQTEYAGKNYVYVLNTSTGNYYRTSEDVLANSKKKKKSLSNKLGLDAKKDLDKITNTNELFKENVKNNNSYNRSKNPFRDPEDTQIDGKRASLNYTSYKNSLAIKKKAQEAYDKTPLGKAEKTVKNTKSAISNAVKKTKKKVLGHSSLEGEGFVARFDK